MEAKTLLNELDIKPSKSLGQSFLINEKIAEKIVNAGSIKKDDTVLEIGPGLGILTNLLANKKAKVYAVEKDEKLYSFLMKKFKDSPQVHILKGDILNLTGVMNFQKKIKLISNLPYSISLPFLMDVFLPRVHLFELCILTLQREVVNKICAYPNTKDYSYLSVFMQYYTTIKVLFPVPARFFFPEPKVSSLTISIIPKNLIPDKNFFKIVKKAFKDRRKMLKNSLGIPNNIEGIDLNRRPDSLSIEEFKTLVDKLAYLI